MRRINFFYFIKPLMRASGFALLAFFLVSCPYGNLPIPLFSQPERAILVITEFLERSNLLVVALLLLLLSLADRTTSPTEKSRMEPVGLREKLIIRSRFIVGMVAIFYLAIIPYTLLESQLLRNVGGRRLTQEYQALAKQLEIVRDAASNKNTSKASLGMLIKKYPWIAQASGQSLNSIDDFREQIYVIEKRLKTTIAIKRSQADNDLIRRIVRLTLFSLILSMILGYFWFYWPNPRVQLPKKELPQEQEDVMNYAAEDGKLESDDI